MQNRVFVILFGSRVLFCSLVAAVLLLSGPHLYANDSAADVSSIEVADAGDPWESVNRRIHGFNHWADASILRPVAVGYTKVTPKFVRRGISNFLDNVGTPAVALNQLLQGKPRLAMSDTGRFIVNTTVGIGGLFDVGTRVGLAEHEEDFGQTFGKWGIGTGNYLVLPFLGSSSVRNFSGQILDNAINPLRFLSPPDNYIAGAVSVIDLRAELLAVDSLVTGDQYIFLRDAFQQRRQFLLDDGAIADDAFDDDGFDEEF